MTDDWVIDSSIGVSWVHPAQATDETDTLLRQVSNGPMFLVPPLWFVESANILLVLQRRKKIMESDRAKYLQFLERLQLQIDDAPPQTAFHAVSELANKHGLTVYDAIYLELALRRKFALATRDELLRRAAKHLGIKTL